MATFSTIHIFGFGEVEILARDNSGKVQSSTLTKLVTFTDHIKSLKPSDVILTDYHVIHVFSDQSVRYLGKGTGDRNQKTSYLVNSTDVNQTILSDFADELISKLRPVPANVLARRMGLTASLGLTQSGGTASH